MFWFVVVVSGADGVAGTAEDVVSVMPYSVSQLYQAERVRTGAERRQADIRQGMMAAEVSRLWQDIGRPLGALRRYRARRNPAIRYAESAWHREDEHGRIKIVE